MQTTFAPLTALTSGLAFVHAASPRAAEQQARALGLSPLGGLSPGPAPIGCHAPWLALQMPVLAGHALSCQLWCLPGPTETWERTSDTGIRLRACVAKEGLFLVAEATVNAPMATQSRHLYTELLSALRSSHHPHPLRFWNYLGDIHGTQEGEERYRLFNQGRREAMQTLGYTVTEGAPAACALGCAEGLLRAAVLAGPRPPQAIENPRQVSAYHYPPRYGAMPPVFSRAALLATAPGRGLLLVSGTASIVGHQSLHEGDVQAQTDEALRNIAALLTRGGPNARLADLSGRVYLRHGTDAAAVLQRLSAQGVQHLSLLQADICRQELLVEIEAEGWVNHAS